MTRCRFCSFNPTSANDFCDKHRPKKARAATKPAKKASKESQQDPKETPKIFKLISENMTSLGGPMGTERTYINWERHYTDLDAAKAHAEKEYFKDSEGGTFKWMREGKNYTSGDLRWVMYTIEPVKIY